MDNNIENSKAEYRQNLINKYGKEYVDLVNILKSNKNIRRHTSLSILKNIDKLGVKTNENTKISILYNWNKFTININGLKRDYSYREDLFIESFAKSFESFSKETTDILTTFINSDNV